MASKLGCNSPHARTAKLAGALALALLVAACGGKDQAAAAPGGGEGGPPGGGMPPMPVEAVTLKTEKLAGGLQTVGSMRADEQVVIRPEIAGRIERINFTEGARVSQGQVLFQLDPSDHCGRGSLPGGASARLGPSKSSRSSTKPPSSRQRSPICHVPQPSRPCTRPEFVLPSTNAPPGSRSRLRRRS